MNSLGRSGSAISRGRSGSAGTLRRSGSAISRRRSGSAGTRRRSGSAGTGLGSATARGLCLAEGRRLRAEEDGAASEQGGSLGLGKREPLERHAEGLGVG